MMELYKDTCRECSALITKRYSTSFSMGIRLFAKEYRGPIYSIYGFVRFADEIVDTFHNHPKKELLDRFREDTYTAIEEGISLNPVLQAFQEVVHDYGIGRDLIDPFLDSMEMDLQYRDYDPALYKQYIFGSAEVVGLMCLKVFCKGDQAMYDRLKDYALALGSAFQKVNFLRDMKSDYDERGRVYFPGVDFCKFDDSTKTTIEADIKADFDKAYIGITQLPDGTKFGVYLAYIYYLNLFKKIKNCPAELVAEKRIRVNDGKKLYLLASSAVKHQLNLI
ncbi:MAG: phytoene/squalene synthase family protein [Bacteroidota bacterium]